MQPIPEPGSDRQQRTDLVQAGPNHAPGPCTVRTIGGWAAARRVIDLQHTTDPWKTPMLHKVLIDTVGSQAARLLNSDSGLPGAEVEKRIKALVQSALAKLDVVSREEFETQQLVLLRTRERLEALEKRVAELENQP